VRWYAIIPRLHHDVTPDRRVPENSSASRIRKSGEVIRTACLYVSQGVGLRRPDSRKGYVTASLGMAVTNWPPQSFTNRRSVSIS
jgi:hypothetical protein